jgi:hypothetical protein
VLVSVAKSGHSPPKTAPYHDRENSRTTGNELQPKKINAIIAVTLNTHNSNHRKKSLTWLSKNLSVTSNVDIQVFAIKICFKLPMIEQPVSFWSPMGAGN